MTTDDKIEETGATTADVTSPARDVTGATTTDVTSPTTDVTGATTADVTSPTRDVTGATIADVTSPTIDETGAMIVGNIEGPAVGGDNDTDDAPGGLYPIMRAESNPPLPVLNVSIAYLR